MSQQAAPRAAANERLSAVRMSHEHKGTGALGAGDACAASSPDTSDALCDEAASVNASRSAPKSHARARSISTASSLKPMDGAMELDASDPAVLQAVSDVGDPAKPLNWCMLAVEQERPRGRSVASGTSVTRHTAAAGPIAGSASMLHGRSGDSSQPKSQRKQAKPKYDSATLPLSAKPASHTSSVPTVSFGSSAPSAKPSRVVLVDGGTGGVAELRQRLPEDKIVFNLVQVWVGHRRRRSHIVLVVWKGPQVPHMQKQQVYFQTALEQALQPVHSVYRPQFREDLNEQRILHHLRTYTHIDEIMLRIVLIRAPASTDSVKDGYPPAACSIDGAGTSEFDPQEELRRALPLPRGGAYVAEPPLLLYVDPEGTVGDLKQVLAAEYARQQQERDSGDGGVSPSHFARLATTVNPADMIVLKISEDSSATQSDGSEHKARAFGINTFKASVLSEHKTVNSYKLKYADRLYVEVVPGMSESPTRTPDQSYVGQTPSHHHVNIANIRLHEVLTARLRQERKEEKHSHTPAKAKVTAAPSTQQHQSSPEVSERLKGIKAMWEVKDRKNSLQTKVFADRASIASPAQSSTGAAAPAAAPAVPAGVPPPPALNLSDIARKEAQEKAERVAQLQQERQEREEDRRLAAERAQRELEEQQQRQLQQGGANEAASSLGANQQQKAVSAEEAARAAEEEKRLEDMWRVDLDEITILEEKVGFGRSAMVHRALWQKAEVALKQFRYKRLSDTILAGFKKEVATLRELQHHPNVVVFVGACFDPNSLAIITEWLPRGSLHDILEDSTILIDVNGVLRMALDAARGMAFLHQRNMLHRDLKSHNLLVDERWTVKVADFGLARILEDGGNTGAYTECGTSGWVAPEVLDPPPEGYGLPADVFSFGMVMWEMVARGTPNPLSGLPVMKYIRIVKSGSMPTIPENRKEFCPSGFEKLMRSCWAVDPTKRPTFDAIVEELLTLQKAVKQ